MIATPRTRRALDELLTAYPFFDVLKIEWGLDDEGFTGPYPWLLVELGQPSEDDAEVWARHRFAIWKSTGAVHGLQHDGSVTDDPLFTA